MTVQFYSRGVEDIIAGVALAVVDTVDDMARWLGRAAENIAVKALDKLPPCRIVHATYNGADVTALMRYYLAHDEYLSIGSMHRFIGRHLADATAADATVADAAAADGCIALDAIVADGRIALDATVADADAAATDGCIALDAIVADGRIALDATVADGRIALDATADAPVMRLMFLRRGHLLESALSDDVELHTGQLVETLDLETLAARRIDGW